MAGYDLTPMAAILLLLAGALIVLYLSRHADVGEDDDQDRDLP